MVKAVVFDLDGLLVDSEPVWFKARKSFMQRFGLTWIDEDHKKQMGVSTNSWANYTYEMINGKLSHQEIIDGILNIMTSYYENGQMQILPGAEEALEYCSNNFIVGLASGSPMRLINAALNGNKWAKYFVEVVSSDEVEHGKPAPDVYMEIFERLSVLPEECVVIEDSGGGIKAGSSAGAKVIAIPNKEMLPDQEILSYADIILDSLYQIPEAIDKIKFFRET
ncbi:HAD family hydrolase [Bacteroidota bacterium]